MAESLSISSKEELISFFEKRKSSVIVSLCENPIDLQWFESLLKCANIPHDIYCPFKPYKHDRGILVEFFNKVETNRKGNLATIRVLFRGMKSDHTIYVHSLHEPLTSAQIQEFSIYDVSVLDRNKFKEESDIVASRIVEMGLVSPADDKSHNKSETDSEDPTPVPSGSKKRKHSKDPPEVGQTKAIGSSTSRGGAVSISPEVADREFYKMNHSQRGKTIIFNQMHFADPALSTRTGSDKDAENLQKTLSSLGFDVATYRDLKLQGIKDVLDRLAAEDHTESDCLFVAILTHGDETTMAASDTSFSPHILWKQFSIKKCPSLAYKPKIFLLQACRGSDFNEPRGTNNPATKTVQTNAATTNKVLTNIEIPNYGSDILLLYGSIPGFVSLRDPAKGSWLVQAFCRVMKEHMFNKDLLSIITEVCRVVAEEDEYKANVEIDGQIVTTKQTVSFTSMLTRKLQFNKK